MQVQITSGGYQPDELRSLLQKAIRRRRLSDALLAASEMLREGHWASVLSSVLMKFAVEDVGPGCLGLSKMICAAMYNCSYAVPFTNLKTGEKGQRVVGQEDEVQSSSEAEEGDEEEEEEEDGGAGEEGAADEKKKKTKKKKNKKAKKAKKHKAGEGPGKKKKLPFQEWSMPEHAIPIHRAVLDLVARMCMAKKSRSVANAVTWACDSVVEPPTPYTDAREKFYEISPAATKQLMALRKELKLNRSVTISKGLQHFLQHLTAVATDTSLDQYSPDNPPVTPNSAANDAVPVPGPLLAPAGKISKRMEQLMGWALYAHMLCVAPPLGGAAAGDEKEDEQEEDQEGEEEDDDDDDGEKKQKKKKKKAPAKKKKITRKSSNSAAMKQSVWVHILRAHCAINDKAEAGERLSAVTGLYYLFSKTTNEVASQLAIVLAVLLLDRGYLAEAIQASSTQSLDFEFDEDIDEIISAAVQNSTLSALQEVQRLLMRVRVSLLLVTDWPPSL